jgi:hypothetical protein
MELQYFESLFVSSAVVAYCAAFFSSWKKLLYVGILLFVNPAKKKIR